MKDCILRHFNVTTCISVQINDPKKGVVSATAVHATFWQIPTIFISKKPKANMLSTLSANYFTALLYQFILCSSWKLRTWLPFSFLYCRLLTTTLINFRCYLRKCTLFIINRL